MGQRMDWNARDRWQDQERRETRDYSGEFAPEFDRDRYDRGDRDRSSRDRSQWGRSGSTGAATPMGDPPTGWMDRDMRGDRRTHDWEVGDRHYTGQQQATPNAFGRRSRWRDTASGNAANTADYFTAEDYGEGRRAWNGPTGYGAYGTGSSGGYPSSYGYSGRGAYADRDPRGFFDRAVDEVRGWFGDDRDDRERGGRRESHRGKGPGDYTRSDERIREDANDRLTDDHHIDARQISVMVTEGEVTLAGTVTSRGEKRHAEDLVEDISGVKHVQNNLRVKAGSGLEGQGGTLGWGNGDRSVTPDV
ncbi:MAG: BON domain-containing protein [Novosphingobium sp.]